jgi:hypothetical protein
MIHKHLQENKYENMEKINCRTCKYFYVTWDRNFPNGCKAYGFKSQEFPSVFVYKSSGSACKGYVKKG